MTRNQAACLNLCCMTSNQKACFKVYKPFKVDLDSEIKKVQLSLWWILYSSEVYRPYNMIIALKMEKSAVCMREILYSSLRYIDFGLNDPKSSFMIKFLLWDFKSRYNAFLT